jgi:hypothetical protein
MFDIPLPAAFVTRQWKIWAVSPQRSNRTHFRIKVQ